MEMPETIGSGSLSACRRAAVDDPRQESLAEAAGLSTTPLFTESDTSIQSRSFSSA
jgi:hypothetical protein